MSTSGKQQTSIVEVGPTMTITLCAATLAYFLVGRGAAFLALVLTPVVCSLTSLVMRRRKAKTEAARLAAYQQHLEAEFKRVFGCPLAREKSKWAKLQPEVDRRLKELWKNAEAGTAHHAKYWQAVELAEALGFTIPK